MIATEFLNRGVWLDLETGAQKLNALGGFLRDEALCETDPARLGAALNHRVRRRPQPAGA